MDKTIFNRMIKSLDAAFVAAFDVAKVSLHVSKTWTPSDALNELHGRIKSISRHGPRVEVLDTLDGLGVRVKSIERKTFNDCRNRVLHDEYRGDERLVRALRRNDPSSGPHSESLQPLHAEAIRVQWRLFRRLQSWKDTASEPDSRVQDADESVRRSQTGGLLRK
jgi:hypothetical protein